MRKRPGILFLDNTSPDNLALALAATRKTSLLDVIAIFVTGRAAHLDSTASIDKRQERYSSQIHSLNTKRMSGFLRWAGRDIPVFMGELIYRTNLRTVIPHEKHTDERAYDVNYDSSFGIIAGSFQEGLEFLRQYKGEKLLVLAGGPLTELALIMRYCPDIAIKLGTMVVQAGDFGEGNSSNLLGGQGNSFNGACDPGALHDVMCHYEGDVYILPSNITKQRELGFKTPDEIAALKVYPELIKIYRVHYENSAKKRGTSLYIHDLGLVILLEQILQGPSDFPYHWQPVKIRIHYDVPYSREERDQRGTIISGPVSKSDRHIVVWQDVERYRERVATYLQG